jgi:hypothetical protein
MSMTPKYYKYAFAASSPLIDPVQDETTADTAYGAATYKDGFPSQTMIAKGAGGVPPRGRQFNALLNDITLNQMYLQRGSGYGFSDVVAEAGGYGRGAVLQPDDETDPYVYESVVPNNTANFNADTAAIGPYWRPANGLPWYMDWKVYPAGFIVTGEDKKTYKALLANGPGMVKGPVMPGTDSSVWQPYGDSGGGGEAMAYLPIPDTGALRNESGRTQVEDPVEDKDAANKRWVLNTFGGDLSGIIRPTILSPVDNYVFQTFSIGVEVSEIRLGGGGSPSPVGTQIRIIGPNGTDIVANALLSYTTTPSIAVPENMVGESVFVVVRHKDETEGWSSWSDKKPVRMAEVLQRAPSMTYPARNAQNIAFSELTLSFSAGKWSDGSPYFGSQTQLVVYRKDDDSVLFNSGWVNYCKVMSLPAGLLVPGKTYWAAVQHRALAAPDSNPDACLESPKISDPDDGNASVFTTMAAKAPDVSGLQHSFPGGMNHGMQVNAAIWGATSTDGTAVSYDIRSISYGLSFSKTSGIAANENIVIGASAGSQVYTASFQIVAKSASGAEAAPTVASVVIVQPISVSYINAGNYVFTAPASGCYQIITGGGGADGRKAGTHAESGGGGGCAIHNAVRLTAGESYNVTVGAAGGTTSFHGIVYATGGTGSTPGQGYGGQSNTTGGWGVSGPDVWRTLSGGGGAGTGNGGNGSHVQNASGFAPGGASGGGSGGQDGEGIPLGRYTVNTGADGGFAGYAGGGGAAFIHGQSIAGHSGGHGCCLVNWVGF